MEIAATLKQEIKELFALQKENALRKRSETTTQRIHLLKSMIKWIIAHQPEIREALYADFKKPFTETDLSEIFVVTSEIQHAIKNLKQWMKPIKLPTPLPLVGSKSYIYHEPKGTALLIGPWNYPFNLVVGPLVSAIASGCTVILKPSEIAPHTAALLEKFVTAVFDKNSVTVIAGDVSVSKFLLTLPFDHIFFTGSPVVGKAIMKAAAENLASVTLELGGKSPVVVDGTADLSDAAEKIVFGKFSNCGQTCVAPDYVLVHISVEKPFLLELAKKISVMYDPDNRGIVKSEDYARIINPHHLNRLRDLLSDAKELGAQVFTGGTIDDSENYFEPTIVTDVFPHMKVMQEEIFGPILPVLHYNELQEVIDFINTNPKPLALYVFTKEAQVLNNIMVNTSSGATVLNDCIIHFTQPELPFGGVNNSGIGKSHGYFGFKAFSNEKAILKQRIGFTPGKLLYPPYGRVAKRIISSLIRWF